MAQMDADERNHLRSSAISAVQFPSGTKPSPTTEIKTGGLFSGVPCGSVGKGNRAAPLGGHTADTAGRSARRVLPSLPGGDRVEPMEHLHAPWRIEYILAPKPQPGEPSVFKQIADSGDDESNLVVAR